MNTAPRTALVLAHTDTVNGAGPDTVNGAGPDTVNGAGPGSQETETTLPEQQIVTDHLGLARALANRFTGRGADRDDLVQVAYLGLIKAARRYDPQQGPFAPFATPTVLGELKRHFRDRGWMVRPPRWIQELQAEIREVTDHHMQHYGEAPSDSYIAEQLRTTVEKVAEARGVRGCYAPRSVDTPVLDTGRPFHETVAVEESGFDHVEDLATLLPEFRRLDQADRDLLHQRFVEERTQKDIADELGISQMQVSRRLSRLLARLRSALQPDAVA